MRSTVLRWTVGTTLLWASLAACADPGTTAPTGAPAEQPRFALSTADLDQLFAPVALYSDAVLAQVLIAATYPLDIVEADRWNQQHSGWSPDALEAAAVAQPWDASVKALLPFSQLLALLDQNIGWTEQLGEAFLQQRADVADSIQRLRQRAVASGGLQSSPEQQVTQDGTDLVIAPTNADVVYVPVYQPEVVYAPWPWPDQMPVVLAPPPGGIWVGAIYWCAPVLGASWLWGRWNWQRHDVEINLPRYNNAYNPHLVSPVWGFVAIHRRGVPFHLGSLTAQYRAAAPIPMRASVTDGQRLANAMSWRPEPASQVHPPRPSTIYAPASGRVQPAATPATERGLAFPPQAQRVPAPALPVQPVRPQTAHAGNGQNATQGDVVR